MNLIGINEALELADEAWNAAEYAVKYGSTTTKKMNAYLLCLLQDCAEMIRAQHVEIQQLKGKS